MKNRILIIYFLILGAVSVFPQDRTVGLFVNTDNVYDGYTLFAPQRSNTTYLIDNNGELVHSWESDGKPGLSVYLLPNGNLLRTQSVVNQTINAGGGGGEIVEIDWDGNKVWEFSYSSSTYRLHHDIEYLPNGNVLMIAWAYKSEEESLNAGRQSDLIFDNAVWYTRIIEVQPTGNSSGEIVWEWNVWDHLVQDYDSTKDNYGTVEEHPELIDLNYVENPDGPNNSSDWLHTNGIDYNEELDQILLSVHNFSEIWIIDHSTTTEEAAGHTGGICGKGGDLLYRWGNPEAYGGGTSDDRKLYNQHDAEWIPDGYPGENNITIFNNGHPRLRAYSSVEEIVPPYDESGNYNHNTGGIYAPESSKWSYEDSSPTDFFAQLISGAQRLENGNTLICSGPYGDFFEVDSEKNIIWRYINPVVESGALTQGDEIPGSDMQLDNQVFRAVKYPLNYSAFDGKDLTPKGTIELYATEVEDTETVPEQFSLYQNYPNPFNPSTKISYTIAESANVKLDVFDSLGRKIKSLSNEFKTPGNYSVVFNAENISSGIYFYRIEVEGVKEIKKMILQK